MRKPSSFQKYVSISTVVHVLVLGGLFLFGKRDKNVMVDNNVSIDVLTSEDLYKLNPRSTDLIKKEIQKLKYQVKDQIVEQNEKSINEEVSESARFLSVKNQTVTKQTIAQEKGQFQNLKKSSPQSNNAGDGKLSQKGQNEQSKSTVNNKQQIAKNLFSTFDPNEALERNQNKETQNNSPSSGKGLGQETGDQQNTADSSKTNDYIKDIDDGLETMLNTREFKYYSYYNRIRRQLTQHWEGKVRQKLTKMFREGRSPASAGQDRITKLMILLDTQGTLIGVQVLNDSGVQDLDDAAIDAFRAAAPFPNPPKGIIENDGIVKIRWDFVLES